MGLWFVWRAVDESGGTIGFEKARWRDGRQDSGAGGGRPFDHPVTPGPRLGEGHRGNPVRGRGDSQGPVRPPVVLVVKDVEHLAELYARWLQEGYRVRPAYDGRTALERIDDYHPGGKEELRRTVSRMVNLAGYDRTCREHYALVSTKAATEAGANEFDLQEHQEDVELLEAVERLRDRSDADPGNFGATDVDAAVLEPGR